MITPSRLVKEASDRLVDQEPGHAFETWSEDQLLAAFNYAVGIIAQKKPEEFTTPVTQKLASGSLQTAAGCDQFLPPYTLLDARKEYVSDLVQSALRGMIRQRTLCAGSRYVGYTFSKTGEHTFELWPPLPPDVGTYYVQGQCMTTPIAEDADTPLDIATYLHPALLELMMHYAHMYDIEAQPSRARAQTHWDNAMLILGVANARTR